VSVDSLDFVEHRLLFNGLFGVDDQGGEGFGYEFGGVLVLGVIDASLGD
jgi:hypothetical protein